MAILDDLFAALQAPTSPWAEEAMRRMLAGEQIGATATSTVEKRLPKHAATRGAAVEAPPPAPMPSAPMPVSGPLNVPQPPDGMDTATYGEPAPPRVPEDVAGAGRFAAPGLAAALAGRLEPQSQVASASAVVPPTATPAQPVAAPAAPPAGAPPVPSAGPQPGLRPMPQQPVMPGFASGASGLMDAVVKAFGGDTSPAHNPQMAYQILTSRGMSPQLAQMAASDPRLFRSMIPGLVQGGDKRQVINNKLIDTRTGEVLADYSDDATKGPAVVTIKDPATGDDVSAIWDGKQRRYVRVDANGMPVQAAAPAALAPSGAGGAPPSAAPATVGPSGLPAPANEPRKQREARQAKEGDVMGEARAALPKVLNDADNLLKHIDGIEKHKQLDKVIGPWDNFTPTLLGESKDVEARIDQLKGETFLQAFQALKGAGAITGTEGDKATDALSRMQKRGVDEASYRAALKEFREEVVKLKALAKRKAGLAEDAPDATIRGGGRPSAANDPLGIR